jgi:hypothetical protein
MILAWLVAVPAAIYPMPRPCLLFGDASRPSLTYFAMNTMRLSSISWETSLLLCCGGGGVGRCFRAVREGDLGSLWVGGLVQKAVHKKEPHCPTEGAELTAEPLGAKAGPHASAPTIRRHLLQRREPAIVITLRTRVRTRTQVVRARVCTRVRTRVLVRTYTVPRYHGIAVLEFTRVYEYEYEYE